AGRTAGDAGPAGPSRCAAVWDDRRRAPGGTARSALRDRPGGPRGGGDPGHRLQLPAPGGSAGAAGRLDLGAWGGAAGAVGSAPLLVISLCRASGVPAGMKGRGRTGALGLVPGVCPLEPERADTRPLL